MTIAQAFNEIAVAHGGTAAKSGAITAAIDALNDALAGSDQPQAKTIEQAVRLLGEHIGGGGGEFVSGAFVSCRAKVNGNAVLYAVGIGTQPVSLGTVENSDDWASVSENATIFASIGANVNNPTIACFFTNFDDPDDKISVDTETGIIEIQLAEGMPPFKYAYAKVKKPTDNDSYGFVMNVTSA